MASIISNVQSLFISLTFIIIIICTSSSIACHRHLPLTYRNATFDINNFDITGVVIDDHTRRYMLRSRCGVPDMFGGFNTMDHGFFEGRPRWSRTNLSYTLESNVPEGAKATIRGAFLRWSEVSVLRFHEATGAAPGDITVGFLGGEGSPFDGQILGYAFAPEDGRVYFNADQPWSFDPTIGADYYDLATEALHQIGHALGLAHTGESAVMHPLLGIGEERSLTTRDINRINQLYPFPY